MKRIRITTLIALNTFCAPHALAEFRLARIFADHMVIQQEMPIHIWGWAKPGGTVAVEMNGKSANAVATDSGAWRVQLPAMAADGKSHQLAVRESGGASISVEDVLLGEVWIAAGQSNMNREVAVDDDPQMRVFWIHGSTIPRQHDLGENAMGWEVAHPARMDELRAEREKIGGRGHKSGFAEVGWVFGKRIREELDVPVGLIKSAFGGSQARAWTPVEKIEETFPFDEKVEGSYLGHKPGLLYQSMLHGLAPLGVRGVVWYQGENNGRDWKYDEELAAMIASWRAVFGQPELPFYLAQIAQTTYASGTERVWECQAKVAREDPHVHLGMSVHLYDDLKEGDRNAVRVHAGNERDPGTGWPIAGGSNPHPPNKHIVANRLADIALSKTYGVALKREVLAPAYASHKAEGNKIIITFDGVGEGLRTDDGKPPNWLEVSDGTPKDNRPASPLVYHKAAARITGKDTVEVRCNAISSPVHVRLAWHALARHNLQNSSGIPAVNFRTDTRPTKRR